MVMSLNEEELLILNEALSGSQRLRPVYKYFYVNATSKQGSQGEMFPFKFHTCFDYSDVYSNDDEEFNYVIDFISDKEKFINYCDKVVKAGYTMA